MLPLFLHKLTFKALNLRNLNSSFLCFSESSNKANRLQADIRANTHVLMMLITSHLCLSI